MDLDAGQTPPAAASKATVVRWSIAALLSAAATIAYLDRIIIANVVKEIQAGLDLTPMQAGWILSSFVIGYGLMQVPTGRLGDRMAVRFALPAIMVLWSLMTGLTVVAGTFSLLFAVRCAFGVAQAGVFPFTIPALRRWFPLQARGTAQAVVVTGTRAGAILAALAAPVLASIGWELGFLLCASMGLVWSVLFVWWFRDRPEQHAHANAEEVRLIGADAPRCPEASHVALATLIADKNIWGMSLGQFFSAMGYYLYITWFPTYLREAYHFDMGEAGLLTALPHIGGFLGTNVGGGIVDWLLRVTGSICWSRRGVWLVGKVACGVLFQLAWSVSNPYMAVGLIALAAACSDSAGPASWAAVIDVGRRTSGTVFGIQNTCGAVGAALCPLVVPWVAQSWGWHLVLPVFGGIFFAAAASWLWVDASRPVREPGEE